MSKPKFMPSGLYSRIYRLWSVFLHKRGYHYTGQPGGPEGNRYWCQWCGLRGMVASKADLERARKELTIRKKK